jgi:16S rRNA (uracil1498-N3)-methyltransferase
LHEGSAPVKLFLWEREQDSGLRETLARFDAPPAAAAFLAGPEGGFSIEEGTMARAAGFEPVSLGPRILRTETAGIAMLSILQYQWGDMG